MIAGELDTPEELDSLYTLHSEARLGKLVECLDDGFVRLVDSMGTDAAIVQAARVSYGKGTKKKSDDRALIRYLMRHYHTTPFEMVEFKFQARVPMDGWRQWIRQRMASMTASCIRYLEAIDSAQTTPANRVCRNGDSHDMPRRQRGKRTTQSPRRELVLLSHSKRPYGGTRREVPWRPQERPEALWRPLDALQAVLLAGACCKGSTRSLLLDRGR